MGGGANPQYLTLANVNAVLEHERKKYSRIPKQFSKDLLFPAKLLGKPYPKGYKSLKFNSFDGRKRSVVQHLSIFIHIMNPYAKRICQVSSKFIIHMVHHLKAWVH